MDITVISNLAAVVNKVVTGKNGHYFSRYYDSEEQLYSVLINILYEYRDSKYTRSVCRAPDRREISASMMCFRNPPKGFYDYSDYARMKVRIQYKQDSDRCVIMCQKKYQLESFTNKFLDKKFNPATDLVLIGST